MNYFKKLKISILFLSILIGILSGLGAYTFYYAKGTSYLFNEPEVCINCHIMKGQYYSWEKSSHHAVAVCNDCHLPHDLLGKYYIKGENGFLHSRAFTLMNFNEPIIIRPKSAEIVKKNCLYCHNDMTYQISTKSNKKDILDCTHCHKNVGHGANQF